MNVKSLGGRALFQLAGMLVSKRDTVGGKDPLIVKSFSIFKIKWRKPCYSEPPLRGRYICDHLVTCALQPCLQIFRAYTSHTVQQLDKRPRPL